MTKADLKQLKKEQRSSQNLYATAVYFPTSQGRANLTDEDRTGRSSLLVAQHYICEGNYGCKDGDCMKCFETSDILSFRLLVTNSRANAGNISMKDYLHQQLERHYNRSDMVWSKLTVHLDQISSVSICPAAFGLLSGATSSQLRAAASAVMQGDLPVQRSVVLNKMQQNEQRSLHFGLLRAYVAELVNKHEVNPAPGAYQPDKVTTMNKTTMKQKWAACVKYFSDAPGGTPGSKSMLRRAWKLETRLKEKRACSHSKCVTCSDLCARNERVFGVKGEAAQLERTFVHRAMVEHEEKHLAGRMELDQAGLQACVDPHHMWTIVADAATQRNFLLPKFQFRTPKDLARRPFWSYKLMATYAYGYGFTPFLVHDSQTMGANLTWTVIWLTLCSMRDHHGYWPQVLHLTLDNTTGENKNEVLIAMCAWLVSSGKVKQVRVLFLMVGHTHIIIDQIFGVITVGLRRKELLVPEDLVRNIEATLAENPEYMAKPVQILSCLWDFSAWVSSDMKVDSKIERLFKGNIQDEHGAYSGMYDFSFKQNAGESIMALMQYREHCTFPWLPEASLGAEVISLLPLRPPGLQQVKSYQNWACSGTMNVRDTISISLKYARTAVSTRGCADVLQLWDQHFERVPNSIELLRPDLRLVFRHFDNEDVLRLTGTTGTTGTPDPEDDMEKLYEEWKRNNVDVRTAPMAIDPVVSSAQSKTQFEKAKAALQAALRVSVGPSISVNAPIFLGDFLLVKLCASDGITLGSVQTISNQQSPYSANLTATIVLYEHKPNAQVSGLFGTFAQAAVMNGAKRQQVRKQLSRAQVVVFNAEVTKTKHLSLATLRVLAVSLPNEYPVPPQRDIPETHLDDKEQRETRRTQRASERAAKSAKKPVKTRKGAQYLAESDSSEESTDDSSSEEESEHELDESSEEGEDDPDGSEPDQDEEDELMPEADVATGVLQLVPPRVPPIAQVVPDAETVIALNMQGDPQYLHMKYPVGLAFVVSNGEGTMPGQFRVAWFALPATQLGVPERRSGPRPFKTINKNVTFDKEWIKHNWWTDKKNKPSIDQIMNEWYTSLAMAEWVLPIRLPQPTPEDVKAKDKFKMTMEFVKNALIPACEAAGCVHKAK